MYDTHLHEIWFVCVFSGCEGKKYLFKIRPFTRM